MWQTGRQIRMHIYTEKIYTQSSMYVIHTHTHAVPATASSCASVCAAYLKKGRSIVRNFLLKYYPLYMTNCAVSYIIYLPLTTTSVEGVLQPHTHTHTSKKFLVFDIENYFYVVSFLPQNDCYTKVVLSALYHLELCVKSSPLRCVQSSVCECVSRCVCVCLRS